jgi:hypothetical protein
MMGGEGASRIGIAARALTGKDDDLRKEQLKSMGITGERQSEMIRQLTSKDQTTRAQALTKILKEGLGGAIDPGTLEGGEKGKAIAGVQTKYIEANAVFVTAVSRFVSALGQVWKMEGLPELPASEELKGGTK